MRREVFHSFLGDESNKAVDIHEMKSLLDRHPYSHIVRLAYLKSLHAINDDRLGHALDEAAIHMPNRKVLFSFMEGLDDNRGLEVGPSLVAEEGQPDVSEKENESENDDSTRQLQRQYLTEAVQSSILLEVGEEKVAQSSEEATVNQEEPIVVPLPSSFLEFIAGEAAFAPEHNKEQLADDEVLARYLSNDKRKKTEFFDSTQMAKKSLDDSGGLVSDTLARIYINQGNLERALDAYEQLILKYPEKSGYFAARIQKVEELKRKKQTSK